MAIEFDCPHCGHHYRLKEELAGKAAACKNCRNKITIPSVSDDTPLPTAPVDIEATAAAAFSDEAKVQEDTSKKLIAVECSYCSHKWTEPLARAGKNTLCPECRQRVKIPEPKDEGQYDWRHTRTKGPEGAKQNQEKLEGVQDAAEVKQVSGKALKEAGAIDEELEPRSLKRIAMFALLIGGPIVGAIFAVGYWWNSRKVENKFQEMSQVQEELKGCLDSLPKEEAPLHNAVMHVACGEYALREEKKLKEAMDHLAKARASLGTGNSPTRNAILAEVAVAILSLGGTEEQAREQIRIRWLPDHNLKIRPNEQVFTVHEELRKVLGLAQSGEFDFRTHLARRLTRELAKRGQPAFALELIPVALFNPREQAEAKAIVALELYRAKEETLAQKAAKELAALGPQLQQAGPKPASAHTLFLILKQKSPLPYALPAGGPISDEARFAYTGLAILEGKADEALEIAQRSGGMETRLRALVLCADWLADPAQVSKALDLAYGIVSSKTPKDPKFSPYTIHRLAQIAAEKGKYDQAKDFANKLFEENMSTWVKGDAIHLRLAAAPNEKSDDAWSELPEDPKKIHVGHSWGRLWIARQNTRITGDRSEQMKLITAWPSPLSCFGKAGIALGIQDRDK